MYLFSYFPCDVLQPSPVETSHREIQKREGLYKIIQDLNNGTRPLRIKNKENKNLL